MGKAMTLTIGPVAIGDYTTLEEGQGKDKQASTVTDTGRRHCMYTRNKSVWRKERRQERTDIM